MKYLIEQNITKEECQNVIYKFKMKRLISMILLTLSFLIEISGVILFIVSIFTAYKINSPSTSYISFIAIISLSFLLFETLKGIIKIYKSNYIFDLNKIPDSYTIKFDNQEIIIDDKSYKWDELSVKYRYKNYIILFLDDAPIILSLNEKSKSVLSDIIKEKPSNFKKKALLLFCFSLSVICAINTYNNLSFMINSSGKPVSEFDDKSGMVFVYSETTSLGHQMQTAYNETKESHQCFNIYYSYMIKNQYNTLVKIYKDDNGKFNKNPEIWFFDNEECLFGMKLDSEAKSITYIKDDKSYLAYSEDDKLIVNKKAVKSIPWKNKFFQLTEFTKEKEDCTYVSGLPDDSAVIFYNYENEELTPFIYTFKEKYFTYEENQNENSFIILLKETTNDRIRSTENLFYDLIEKHPKGDIGILINEIYRYNAI